MTVKTGKTYRLYAKPEGHKRFSPLDVSRGALVGNLIYATLFEVKDDETKTKVDDMLAWYRENYPQDKFELRVVDGT